MRTPTWFVASPMRTPRRGSLWVRKNSSSPAASAGTSVTSPETTIPAGSVCRSTWSSFGLPLPFATRAAAICVAPSFTPTSSPVAALAPKRDRFLPAFAADCFFGPFVRERRTSFFRFMRHLPGV